jgi:hypothetical protein
MTSHEFLTAFVNKWGPVTVAQYSDSMVFLNLECYRLDSHTIDRIIGFLDMLVACRGLNRDNFTCHVLSNASFTVRYFPPK